MKLIMIIWVLITETEFFGKLTCVCRQSNQIA